MVTNQTLEIEFESNAAVHSFCSAVLVIYMSSNTLTPFNLLMYYKFSQFVLVARIVSSSFALVLQQLFCNEYMKGFKFKAL